jgi:hypothetical protein
MPSLQSVTPLVVPPLLQLEGHRLVQAVYLSFESRVPCELPLPPKPILQAYFILNTSWYRTPRISTRSTLGSGQLEGPASDAGQILDTVPMSASSAVSEMKGILLSRHAWNLDQSAHLKSGRSGRLRKVDRHLVSISMGKWSELSAEHAVRYTGVGRFLVTACLGHRGLQTGCRGQWWVTPARGSSRNVCRHNHTGAFPSQWSAESSNRHAWRWGHRP